MLNSKELDKAISKRSVIYFFRLSRNKSKQFNEAKLTINTAIEQRPENFSILKKCLAHHRFKKCKYSY